MDNPLDYDGKVTPEKDRPLIVELLIYSLIVYVVVFPSAWLATGDLVFAVNALFVVGLGATLLGGLFYLLRLWGTISAKSMAGIMGGAAAQNQYRMQELERHKSELNIRDKTALDKLILLVGLIVVFTSPIFGSIMGV